MKGYEKEYHTLLHRHLYSSKEYYLIRAKLALKKYFNNIPKKEKIIEFGCGLGQNIYFLPNAIGYDISKFSLNFCRKMNIKVVENLNKTKNDFDCVFSAHVLEHMENPYETLKLMKSKLKKGGKLILILPAEKHKKAAFKVDKNQHLYCWNFQVINNLLIKTGFDVVENKYVYGSGYRKLLAFSRINLELYDFLTKLVSFITCAKEMKIVAIKRQ